MLSLLERVGMTEVMAVTVTYCGGSFSPQLQQFSNSDANVPNNNKRSVFLTSYFCDCALFVVITGNRRLDVELSLGMCGSWKHPGYTAVRIKRRERHVRLWD